MERRKMDILCVQETRWKGSKARSIGAGFKLFYYGVDSKRNGVGVVLKEEFVRNVLEVKRVSDRVMSLKLEIEGVMLNVVSGYAPQVGCELEEKERFWSELDEVMESIPTGERVVIGADFNGHVGKGNRGDEEVIGKFGVKERNLEGQMVVDFAKRMDMAVVNTYFQKREEHRVTYKSGDLEKVYDRVPREELWYCLRKSGVAVKYVREVQDMYERSRTVVRCAVGQTEEFKVEVGLHQGSALSPFLFAIVMDQLSEEVRQESPWTMMFADDIVICSESREQVEENLERWRFALERRGMKVSCSKTEYMCVNEREGSGTVRLQGEEVKKVQELKYLGSTVQCNGECAKEVKKRVQAGWNGWRKVSGVLCDRKISVRIKGKVYRTVVRPVMLNGLETVSLRKGQGSEVAELKMLRFSLGVTRLDRIRNEYIRGTAHVGRLGDKVREARLRWFGHVQRRESDSMADPIEPLFTHKVVDEGDSMADSIESLFTHKTVDEGDEVTLSCKYKFSVSGSNYLQWYRQYPQSKPDFLLYISTNGDLSQNIPPRMSPKVYGDEQVDLIISSAAISDSALYYCALRPTVTGNPAALYKNLDTILLY
ncbi:hypothetical protein QTP70_007642 [Hemibagrus guttatus]|uniref:ribonuclease H n=1 Tax=Hemibagrus guttatus TaxID=175788 RepID=A0AAE0R6U0_9TELE|nr:hypothetical protein QTP70_007642 [Hemibagrus guttatus]